MSTISVFRLIVPVIGIVLPPILDATRSGRPLLEHFELNVMSLYLATPFLVLAGLSWVVRSRIVLGVALVSLIAAHCYTWYAVNESQSSTAVLGILAAPIYELFIVLPAVVLVGLLIERAVIGRCEVMRR